MSKDITSKISKSIEDALYRLLPAKLDEEIPDIIDIGVESYENLLLGLVANSKSLSNPENFYDAYVVALEDFKYIDEESSDIVLQLPNEENFDFTGELEVLRFIVEGTAGMSLELPDTDLNKVLNTKGVDPKIKRRLRDLPGVHTSSVPLSMRFSLLPTRGNLSTTVQAVLDKKLIKFPFSNHPPIDLFGPMHEYVYEKMPNWIDTSIEKAIKFTQQKVR